MKYVITLNGKLFEEATLEKRMELEKRAKKSFEKHFGIKYPDYILEEIREKIKEEIEIRPKKNKSEY